MDASSEKDVTWFFGEFWSTLVVALVIYGGGRTAEQVVTTIWPQSSDFVTGKVKALDTRLPLLFRLWWSTRLSHPFIVGALISLVPQLPHPQFVTSHTSGALWFGLAGMGNGQVHMIVDALTNQMRKAVDLFVPWVRQRLGLSASQSTVPAEPRAAEPAHDPTPSGTVSVPEDTGGDDPPEAA